MAYRVSNQEVFRVLKKRVFVRVENVDDQVDNVQRKPAQEVGDGRHDQHVVVPFPFCKDDLLTIVTCQNGSICKVATDGKVAVPDDRARD